MPTRQPSPGKPRKRSLLNEMISFSRVCAGYLKSKGGALAVHFNDDGAAGLPASESDNGMEVVLGTHPIPQNYFETHQAIWT